MVEKDIGNKVNEEFIREEAKMEWQRDLNNDLNFAGKLLVVGASVIAAYYGIYYHIYPYVKNLF